MGLWTKKASRVEQKQHSKNRRTIQIRPERRNVLKRDPVRHLETEAISAELLLLCGIDKYATFADLDLSHYSDQKGGLYVCASRAVDKEHASV